MNNISTYFATRKNVFLWLASILSVFSLITRIISVIGPGQIGGSPIWFLILPIIANLLIAIRLPLRGEQQFYISILPIIMLSVYLALVGKNISSSGLIATVSVVVVLVFALLYFTTFIGRIPTKYMVLVYLIGICLMAAINSTIRDNITTYYPDQKWLMYSDGAIVLSIISVILSARKMPPLKEGDPYRLRFGDRLDGRRIHNMPIMSKVTPHFMATRLGRSNYIAETLELNDIEEYVRSKRKEGYKNFGITHVLVAAYIRTIADFPELNRFVAGQRVYHRFETSVNMVVKKEMNKNSPDSSIKVLFEPSDTAVEIYEKFNTAMEKAKEEGISNGFDSITHVLDYLPSVIMALFAFLLRVMDYFSILPMALERVSPFHGSLFITSMGSLGIPPIYHHLYDFGTVPVFCAFGHKYSRNEIERDGTPVVKKYMDYKIVCDEGICDGFYYAAALKKMKSYMKHPEKLDIPPERVAEDIY